MDSSSSSAFRSIHDAPNGSSPSFVPIPSTTWTTAQPAVLITATLCCAVLAAVVADAVLLSRRPRAGEPPLVRSRVPFLRSALSFGVDGLGLFTRCRAEYGDVFTIQLAGQAMHAVCDPRYYSSILRNQQLTFHEIGKTIQHAIFDQSMRSVDSEVAHRDSHAQYVQHLSGPGLEEVTSASCRALRRWMREDRAQLSVGQWRSVDLDAFVSDAMVSATLESLFGRRVAAKGPALHRSTRIIDRSFFQLFYRLPAFLCRDAHDARAHLIRTCMSDGEPDEAELVTARRRMCRELAAEFSRYDEASFMAGLLFASLTNSVPMTTWVLAMLFTHPDAMHAVSEELSSTLPVRALDEEEGEEDRWTRQQLAACRVTMSAIDETLRMTVSPSPMRVALADTTISSTTGTTYRIRKGDTVAIVAALTHADGRVFADPERYHFDRFLSPEPLTLEGQKVPHALMPFGGGVSLCPGRHWAKNEILAFVAMIVQHLQWELEGSQQLPERDKKRLGVFGAKTPLRLRYRYRS